MTRGRTRVTIAASTAILLLAACTGSDDDGGSGAPSPVPAAPVEVRIMEFNIEYGGDIVDFGSVPETIRAADADVVALEEAWGNTARIARELGWDHFDPALHLVSRFPLVRPANAGNRYTFVEVVPGRVIAVGNVHLSSAPYGPRRIAQGADAEEAIALEERVRMPELEPVLQPLASLATDGTPAVLAGDFNAPSHLDWTEETVDQREHLRFPVAWPMSIAVEEAGFVDTYREIHPDPVREPGLTWPSARPHVEGEWNPGPNAQADRIDFVYAGGAADVLDSEIVGERGADDVGISVAPWPTDHRGVLSTLEVVPAAMPAVVSVDRQVVEEGSEVVVRWSDPGGSDVRVLDVAAGGSPDDGEPVATGTSGSQPYVVVSGAGPRELVLVDDEREVTRAPFWVAEPGTGPTVTTSQTRYAKGESITVEWTNAPGNRWDWVGLYRRDADPNVAWYLNWLYVDAAPAGTVTFDDDENGRWPLEPGRYSVYLLADDGYDALAAADFIVVPAG